MDQFARVERPPEAHPGFAGSLMIAGSLLLAVVWVFLLRYVPDGAFPEGPGPFTPTRSDLLRRLRSKGGHRAGVPAGVQSRGRVASRRPDAHASDSHHGRDTYGRDRIALHTESGYRAADDEFRELADAFDEMLTRLEAQVAEQQRFAANASHELRTPLAITQTLLDVARSDPYRGDDELVEHLHVVNTRAIDLTEALFTQPRRPAVLRPGTRRPVPHSRGSHRDAPPPRRRARPHHRDLRRRDPHHRLARPAAADGDKPRAQRDRPQPA